MDDDEEKGDDFSSVGDDEMLQYNQAELEDHFKKLNTKMNSAASLRQFLQGVQFAVRIKGVQLNIFSPTKEIIDGRTGKAQPNFQFDLDGLSLFLECINDYQNMALLVKLNLKLNHIMITEASR